MERIPHASVDEMLSPATLRELTALPVQSVNSIPITPAYAKSGSQIFLVETNGTDGPRFILKKVSMASDWLMRATDDHLCRTVQLWLHGVFDHLPLEIEHGILACARDNDGWALLMQDLGSALLDYTPFKVEENELYLDAMAALHAHFFEALELKSLDLGLCRVTDYYKIHSPQTGRREASGADEVPKRALEGWEMVPDMVASDVVEVLQAFLEDPQPLCNALNRYPQTLIHGDWRHANQGLLRGERGNSRVVLLDWQLAGAATPSVELGRYLGTNSALLPVSKEEALDYYQHRLAHRLGPRFDVTWWQPQLELGLLGGFVQDAWAMALKATHWRIGEGARDHWRADLAWWSERVREGVKWL